VAANPPQFHQPEEGCTRRWAVLTKKLAGDGEQVKELHGIEVEWTSEPQP